MNNKYKKNIKLEYIFKFFCNFAIVDGIFILFLIQKGIELWQIGILEGVFHAASILSEIPSGALADLIGRKKVMIMASICSIISSIIMISTNNIWLLGIEFIFSAWSFNLMSGSEEALLYDTFIELGQEEKYFKTNGRLGFIAEVSQGIALLLGGYLAEISYLLCYAILICVDLTCVFLCMAMTEAGAGVKEVSVKGHFTTSFNIIKGNGKLQFVLFYYSILFAFHTCVFLYAQEYYHAMGISESRIGIILLLVCVCTSLGSLCSEQLSKMLGEKARFVCAFVSAMGLMLMCSNSLVLSVAGFCINSIATSVMYPLQSNELNRLIPSGQRATIISVSSMCYSVIMICLFPVVGYAARYISLGEVILGAGVILFVYSMVVVFVKYRKNDI